MKQYSKINWAEKDEDELYDFMYEELDEEEQYNFFEWLMQHFPNLEIDWLEIFEDFQEELIQNNKIDKVISFTEWYKLKNLNDYRERFEFIERDLCDQFFYKNDLKKLQERIAFLQQNPVQAIDTLTIRVLYQLIYYGHYEMAVNYAESVWKPINESEQLIGFAAYPFINTIYVSQLQQCYEAGLNNISFDEEKLFRQMVEMGFENDKKIFNCVLQALREELSVADVMDSVQKGKDNHMLILNIHFLKYMLHTYQLPFVFSEWIWNFIATTKIFGKLKGIENWFYIDAKTLDKHIVNKSDNILGSNDLEIFGKVWGLDYVFSFLHHHQLLSGEKYVNMIENISFFRNEIMRDAGGSLWQMMFVFNWPRTNNYVVDPSEQRLFNGTYGVDLEKAYKQVYKYCSIYFIPERIKKELKLNNSIDFNRMPISQETNPYVKPESDIGRNELCPCGSGKKYKKCCLDN